MDGKVQGGEGFEEKEAMQVCQIAPLCMQPFPDSRPAMSDTVRMVTMKTDQTIPADQAGLPRAKHKTEHLGHFHKHLAGVKGREGEGRKKETRGGGGVTFGATAAV